MSKINAIELLCEPLRTFANLCDLCVLCASEVNDPASAPVYQPCRRDVFGMCAIKNSIWSARMRRLRKMKSSHRLGTYGV